MTQPQTETAHVLITDRVGYTQVSLERKTQLDADLLDALGRCPSLARLDETQCTRLDTGDGNALVFFTDPVAAMEAAQFLNDEVSAKSDIKLRIGLHSGLVVRRRDANGNPNVSGPGIEKAQRAMSCADGTRVVMTEFFAENLRAFDGWAKRLVDLGEFTVKHGEKLRLYGAAALPARDRDQSRLAIIYRRKAQPDDEVLGMLEERLSKRGFSVFVDRHLSIGVKWATQIETEIREADAVIILLSERSAISEMVLFELQTAIDQQGVSGTPKILPIRIGSDEPIGGDIGALLMPYQYAVWKGSKDDDAVVEGILRAFAPDPGEKQSVPLERVGGAMPPDSPFYIERKTDREFQQALLARDSIVLVKGGRQIGKTSLMARALRVAKVNGVKVVWTDFQSFTKSILDSDERLFLAIAEEFCSQLGLKDDPLAMWREVLGANTNFERFLMRTVMPQVPEPIVWAIDEVDRLFTVAHSSDFFGMIRSWHNRRAAMTEESWSRFTVALAYATEAHLFISDLNQSPFNVGTRLELSDFDLGQVVDLNQRYGSPVPSPRELEEIHALLGGQPYLTRRAFDEVVRHGRTVSYIVQSGALDEGPFGDHLRRLLVALSGDPKLVEDVRGLTRGEPIQSQESFFRLRSGGLLTGGHVAEASFRCSIYKDYFSQHLF